MTIMLYIDNGSLDTQPLLHKCVLNILELVIHYENKTIIQKLKIVR